MNTFVSCLPGAVARFDANTSRLPSGENSGKPSNPGAYVIRSRFAPVTSTAQRSNSRPRGSPWFDEKITRCRFGWPEEPAGMNAGPNDAASR
jgi:hypothetical protein